MKYKTDDPIDGKKTKWKGYIAFDFDGVITEYYGYKGFDNWEDKPIKQVIETMQNLYNSGYYVYVFTTRPFTPTMAQWFEKHNIPYHSVNMNKENPPHTSNKPLYHVIVDDRGINPINYHNNTVKSASELTKEITNMVEYAKLPKKRKGL